MTSSGLPIHLTKSRFIKGCHCLKRLFLSVQSPELGVGKNLSDFALMQQGADVGKLAQQLFPEGVLVRTGDPEEAIRITRQLMADPNVPAIYEAAFQAEDVFVRVDILNRRRDGRWRLIEVKSSADFKEGHFHLEDVAIQYRVVSKSGVDIASCCLAHVNRNYIRDGDIDPRRFFRIRNLTQKVQRLQPKLVFQLRSQFRVLAMPEAPGIKVGSHCTNPIVCEFFECCNSPRAHDHIGYLPRLHASAAERLEDMGIQSILEIPDDFDLTEIQRRAADCVRQNEPWFDTDGLKIELAGLKYPICYMDFETINPCVPRFNGMHPYDHIPFQWSVNAQRQPGAEPEHYEFLAGERTDPRRNFITSLCNVLGERGSIVAYNAGFESARLSELAAWLPEFAERIKNIQSRLWDLLPVIRNHVYHPAFQGSYSLKYVLPALVPGLSYGGMEVANGQDAGLAWEMMLRSTNAAERDRLRNTLLVYCRQDSLGLAKVLEKLRLETSRSSVS